MINVISFFFYKLDLICLNQMNVLHSNYPSIIVLLNISHNNLWLQRTKMNDGP